MRVKAMSRSLLQRLEALADLTRDDWPERAISAAAIFVVGVLVVLMLVEVVKVPWP